MFYRIGDKELFGRSRISVHHKKNTRQELIYILPLNRGKSILIQYGFSGLVSKKLVSCRIFAYTGYSKV